MFNHFLITRFNVKSKLGFDRKFVTDQCISNSRDWLQHRFDLFDRYCYPTVRSQTTTNFKWIVFFDNFTPDFFREKIKKYAEWPNFIPVYIDDFNVEVVKKTICKHKTGKPKFIITTRLDNDDGICNQYLQMTQDKFDEQCFEIFNFYYGYYLTHPSGKLYLRGRVGNTFISLIEKADKIETIWLNGIPHHKLYGIYKHKGLMKNIILEKKPSWVVIFHEKNLSNREDIYHAIRQPRENLLEAFNIRLPSKLAYENKLIILYDKYRFNFRHSRLGKSIKNIRSRITSKLKNSSI